VLLLDEPLSALDYKLRKEMQIELKRLQSETGITFIFVTHDQEEALTMSDRIAVMSAGKILQVGSPREIYDEPSDRFVADFIGETNFLKGKISSTKGQLSHVELVAGGSVLASMASEIDHSGEITVVIRPEHAQVTAVSGKNARHELHGVLSNIVYFGTDTHFHVTLGDGTNFIVRHQNKPHQTGGLAIGDRVAITVADKAARVLRN
jgi:spermidine/putrescine transport system ATP-binding protein